MTRVNMQIDTGTPISLMSVEMYKSMFYNNPTVSNAKLRTYTGEEIKVLGSINAGQSAL